jgi:adenylate kinase
MKNIIFIAPPAAGKGTQSDLLINEYNYSHISTGDLLRTEIANKTSLGLKLEDLMKSGSLIDDDIVTSLLKNTLIKVREPFILDGYPRNLKQAVILDELLQELNKKIDLVIYLDVSEEVAIKRATGRISCPKCGRIYHKYFLKPIKDNICDECGTELISRTDDTPETFKVRYQNYVNSTMPLLDYYQNKGLLLKVNANVEKEITFAEIKKVID